MNLIPEWMRPVADVGRVWKTQRQQESKPEIITSLPVSDLWANSRIERDQQIMSIREAGNKSGNEKIRLAAIAAISSQFRGLPFEVTGANFGENCLNLEVQFADNIQGSVRLPAMFNFTVTPKCEVVMPQVFEANNQPYPVTPQGVQVAFQNARKVYAGSIMTKSQIIEHLPSNNPGYVSQMFTNMIHHGEIVDLGSERYALNRLPKCFADSNQTQQQAISQLQKATQEKQNEDAQKTNQQKQVDSAQTAATQKLQEEVKKQQQPKNPTSSSGEVEQNPKQGLAQPTTNRTTSNHNRKPIDIHNKIRNTLSKTLSQLGYEGYEAQEDE